MCRCVINVYQKDGKWYFNLEVNDSVILTSIPFEIKAECLARLKMMQEMSQDAEIIEEKENKK